MQASRKPPMSPPSCMRPPCKVCLDKFCLDISAPQRLCYQHLSSPLTAEVPSGCRPTCAGVLGDPSGPPHIPQTTSTFSKPSRVCKHLSSTATSCQPKSPESVASLAQASQGLPHGPHCTSPGTCTATHLYRRLTGPPMCPHATELLIPNFTPPTLPQTLDPRP